MKFLPMNSLLSVFVIVFVTASNGYAAPWPGPGSQSQWEFELSPGTFTISPEASTYFRNEHELYVYSLRQYETLPDMGNGSLPLAWKPTLPHEGDSYGFDIEGKDPWFEFWDLMVTDCSGVTCANDSSERFQDEDVDVNQMLQGMHGGDMVFFWGHNAAIPPQYEVDDFGLWRPSGFGWEHFDVNWQHWGTATEPYYYHYQTVTDATDWNAYAVYYANNPLTSVLIGQDFAGGSWETENTYLQFIPDTHFGLLGGPRYPVFSKYLWPTPLFGGDLEWLIANGCGSVQVAQEYDGEIVSIPAGVNAYRKSWGRMHMVLGHSIWGSYSGWADLASFAADLKSGDIVRDAYFDAHGVNLNGMIVSAISVIPDTCCIPGPLFGSYTCDPVNCEGGILFQDKWTVPVSDPFTNASVNYYYITSWRTEVSSNIVEDDITVYTPTIVYPYDFEYTLVSQYAQDFIGAKSIPRRAYNYIIDAKQLPKIRFDAPTRDRAVTNLRSAARSILGFKAAFSRASDNEEMVALKTSDGVAWTNLITGATVIKKHDYDRGFTRINDVDTAVDLAVDQLARSKLIILGEHETLDVLGVAADEYAGWSEPEDDQYNDDLNYERTNDFLMPISFEDPETGALVEQYRGEYTVFFGRRWRGIPIDGPPLVVRLDASGKMVALIKKWRTIGGETGKPVDVLGKDDIFAPRDPELAKSSDLQRVTCGYVELDSVRRAQRSPDMGCDLDYTVPHIAEPLSRFRRDSYGIRKDLVQ
ncbi:MAG: hypothetical protein GY854_16985 [Deltaproteobacteria bacterium]|nr:hypothetical protein [Deltaproteobacteria bacterium]